MTEQLNNVEASQAVAETVAAPAKRGAAWPLVGAIGVLAVGAIVYAASVIGGGFGGGSQAGAMYVSPEKIAGGGECETKSHCHKSGDCGMKAKASVCQH